MKLGIRLCLNGLEGAGRHTFRRARATVRPGELRVLDAHEAGHRDRRTFVLMGARRIRFPAIGAMSRVVRGLDDVAVGAHGLQWLIYVNTDARANETGLKMPHREFNLAWRIAGFVVALALIVIASYFIGVAAGHWARQEWAMNDEHGRNVP